MGVLAVDFINSPINNPNYTTSNTGALSSPIKPNTFGSIDLPSKISNAGLARLLPKSLQWSAFLAKNVSDLYSSVQSGINEGEVSEITDFDAFATDINSDISQIKDMLSSVNAYNEITKDAFQEQIDAISPTDSDTLLTVLSQNGQSLTTSLSLFTDVFSNKMDTMNSALTGLLIYFNEYMNLKSEHIPLQIEALRYNLSPQGEALSPRDAQYQKNLSVNESLEFSKTSSEIKDLDGEVVANLSPREAELIKNATVAKETTDKNNLKLDDDEIDIVMPLDISSIFGYSGDTEAIKEFYTRLGGQGTL